MSRQTQSCLRHSGFVERFCYLVARPADLFVLGRLFKVPLVGRVTLLHLLMMILCVLELSPPGV